MHSPVLPKTAIACKAPHFGKYGANLESIRTDKTLWQSSFRNGQDYGSWILEFFIINKMKIKAKVPIMVDEALVAKNYFTET